MNFDIFRGKLVSPALCAIADHWHEARGSGAMPAWDQLRPGRMAPHLSIVWAYKYDASENRFSGRLAGDTITRNLLQKSFRGIGLEELWPNPAQIHRKLLRLIAEQKIYRMAGVLFRDNGRPIEGERIVLPLAGDGACDGGVLGASAYRYPGRSSEPGGIELLDDANEEWFDVTCRTASTTSAV